MWTLPLGPSVELPMGPERRIGRGYAMWTLQRGPSAELPMGGHETCEGCAESNAGTPYVPCRGGLRWGFIWGHET
eukprot:4938641-Pyramimonas_sp.AAC.1